MRIPERDAGDAAEVEGTGALFVAVFDGGDVCFTVVAAGGTGFLGGKIY